MKSLTFAAPLALLFLGGLSRAEVPTLINVEIDYMEVVGGHTHLPSQNALDALVQMFACHGITLNLMVSDAVPHIPSIQCANPGNDPFWSCTDPTSQATYKALYSETAGTPGWHYCLIGHNYDQGKGTGSSGVSDGANDFIVSLGNWSFGTGTDYEIAATFAHELGHDLGLGHSSPNTLQSSGNYAPNYASVMSYQYQLVGVRSKMECLGIAAGPHLFKDLDYSNGRLPLLNEAALFDAVGVGIHEVDWDCDEFVDPFAVTGDLDIRRSWCDASTPAVFSILSDYDDWANLDDKTQSREAFLDEVVYSNYDCIRSDQVFGHSADSDPLDGFPDPEDCKFIDAPTLVIEPCIGGQMIFANPNVVVPMPNGTGPQPYPDLATAAAVASSGSVIFLQPGTFSSEPGPIVISTPMILAGPGGAVVGYGAATIRGTEPRQSAADSPQPRTDRAKQICRYGLCRVGVPLVTLHQLAVLAVHPGDREF